MRFRLGLVTGFAAGYYLGTRAGRQRYDQINRQLARLKRSEAFEEVTEKARAVVDEATEKARSAVEEATEKAKSAVESRTAGGNGHNGQSAGLNATDPAPAPAVSDITGSDPPDPPPAKGLGGYSSSR